MYLSRLILNPRDRQVRRDLADCQQLHTRVMRAFPSYEGPPDRAREHFGVLYRVEQHPRTGAIQLLVQSRAQPDWSDLQAWNPHYLTPDDEHPGMRNPACKSVDDQYRVLVDGVELVFRLRANPTKRVARRNDPLYGKRVELREEDRLEAWMRRKGASNGFALLAVRMQRDDSGIRFTGVGPRPDTPGEDVVAQLRVSPGNSVTGKKNDRLVGRVRRLNFASVVFDGRLRITDAVEFRQALERGIGPGKAYGFGLLSVARG